MFTERNTITYADAASGSTGSTGKEYQGWFSAFGSSGETIQHIFTTVFSILAAAILIAAVIFLIKAGYKLAQADSTEERAEAKKKIIWILVGTGIALLATLLPTILWNTVGKFSEASSGNGGIIK